MDRSITSVLYYLTLASYVGFYNILAIELPGSLLISIADILFILLFLSFIYDLYSGRLIVPVWRSSFNIAIALYIMTVLSYTFIGFLLHNTPVGILSSPIREVQLLGFLPITASVIYNDSVDIRKIYFVLLTILILHIIVSFVQLFSIDQQLGFEFASILTAPAIHEHPNRVAGMFGSLGWFGSVMGLIFIFGAVGKKIECIPAQVSNTMILLSILGILLGVQRSALVMIIPAVIFLLVYYYGFNPLRMAQISSIFIILLLGMDSILSGTLLGRFTDLQYIFRGNPSNISAFEDRLQAWEQAIQIFSQEFWPIGSLVTHRFFFDFGTDSRYINVFLQFGYVGLFIFITVFITIIVSGTKDFVENKSTPASLLAVFSAFGVAIASFVTSPLGAPPSAILFWVTIGIAVGSCPTTIIKVSD